MSNSETIHDGDDPSRTLFIVEWAEKRNLTQAEIGRAVGADKSLVSRWFKGTNPKRDYLEKLAALFATDVQGLFRHPDDDWLSKFFRDKTEEQKERAIEVLKLMFSEEQLRTGT